MDDIKDNAIGLGELEIQQYWHSISTLDACEWYHIRYDFSEVIFWK